MTIKSVFFFGIINIPMGDSFYILKFYKNHHCGKVSRSCLKLSVIDIAADSHNISKLLGLGSSPVYVYIHIWHKYNNDFYKLKALRTV